jgi:predicted AAA+ superfamily ATPase
MAGACPVRLGDYVDQIFASGLPALRGLTGRALRFQLDSYLRNAVDRDVPEQGLAVRKPAAMLGWLRSYAAASATTASYSQILDAATPGQADKPARSTSIAYRDVLTDLWLLDPVPAWTPGGSALTRLAQTPKHHLADPALAVRLLGGREALLDGEGRPVGPQSGSLLGHLFESLATLCVRVCAQAAEATLAHLRTRNGDHEIDLVVIRDDGRILAIEVQLANTVDDRDTRHLHWLADRIGTDLVDAIIINTGPHAYRRPDGIGVVPLGLLGP